jgi:hypothetical protein
VIPEPLRGRDPDTWQYDTVTDRLPAIARRICNENNLTAGQIAALSALAVDMPQGHIRDLNDANAPDSAAWSAYIQPHIGQSWLDAPWFFVEMYFFRRILEATGYFESGPGFGLDPYRTQKMEGIRTAGGGLRRMAELASGSRHSDVGQKVLIQDLWGNQADLSIWPVDSGGNTSSPDGGHLLVDQTAAAVDIIHRFAAGQSRIMFVADNAGLEFLGDLLTIDYFLRNDLTAAVELHVKPYPTFVSDATAPDMTTSLGYLSRHERQTVRAAGIRLRRYMLEGRLRLRSHVFWTSPLAFWEMPADLRRQLDRANLIILKGDMNYRRLLGDRHWPYTTPTDRLPRATGTPILGLRVCKAEVAVGLSQSSLNMVSAADPDWRVNGRWGMAQLLSPQIVV